MSEDFTTGKLIALIVGILCLALIIILVKKSFDAVSDQDSVNAKRIIEVLEKKAKALDNGQSAVFPLQGPCSNLESDEKCEWYLIGWNKETVGRPEKCYFDSCICICPAYNNQTCQDKGFCRTFKDNSVSVFTNIKIDSKDETAPFIVFKNPVLELTVSNKENLIEVSSDDPEMQYSPQEFHLGG